MLLTAYATAVDADGEVSVSQYNTESGFPTSGTAKVLVFGSEYAKGQEGRAGANTPGFKSFDNKPL
jgi:hypothetical protein